MGIRRLSDTPLENTMQNVPSDIKKSMRESFLKPLLPTKPDNLTLPIRRRIATKYAKMALSPGSVEEPQYRL